MTVEAGWQLSLLEDLELPGWFLVPPAMDDAQAGAWIDQMARELSMLADSEDDLQALHEELRYAVAAAEDGTAMAMFQLWPIDQPFSLLCRIDVVDGVFAPASDDENRVVVHAAEGRHLGPGRQFTIQRRQDIAGESIDLTAVYYAFSDGELSLVFGLSEAPAAVCARGLVQLTALKDAVTLRSDQGVTFQAVGQHDAEQWPIEEPTR